MEWFVKDVTCEAVQRASSGLKAKRTDPVRTTYSQYLIENGGRRQYIFLEFTGEFQYYIGYLNCASL
jgi:hypothetical protein